MTLSKRSPVFVSLVAALLAASAAVVPVAASGAAADDAVAAPPSSEHPTAAVAGGDFLDLGYAAGALRFGVRGAGEDAVADPAGTVLTVADDQEFASSIDTSAITASLPPGATAGIVTLTLVSATAPNGGGMQVRDSTGAVVLGSSSGDPGSMTISAGETRTDRWLFNAFGRFALTFSASVVVTDAAGGTTTVAAPQTSYAVQVGGPTATTTALSTDADQVDSGAEVVLTSHVTPSDAVGTVEFYDGGTLLGSADAASPAFTASGLDDGKHSMTARFVPTWSTDYAPSTSGPSIVRVGDSASIAVFDAGNLAITPKITGDGDLSACTASGTCDATGMTLGLLDRTHSTDLASQDWYAPDDAVIHVDAQDGAFALPYGTAFTGLAKIAGTDKSIVDYVGDPPTHLLLGLDAKLATTAGALNGAFAGTTGSKGTADLVSVTSSTGGTLTVAKPSANGDPLWSSDDAAPIDYSFAKASPNYVLGWSFSQAGTYCVTMSQSYTTSSPTAPSTTFSASATYTIIAGPLPDTVVPCAQPGDQAPGGPGDGGDVTQVNTGHHDLRAYVGNDDQLHFGMDSTLVPFDRVVLSNTPAPKTVEAPTDAEDVTAIGPVGTKYWYFPISDSEAPSPWPGFSTESINLEQLLSPITFRLDGFSLNGIPEPDGVVVAALAETSDSFPGSSLFNTRLGYPSAFQAPAKLHEHPQWTFTAEGVYCLSLSATAQLADGHWSTTTGQMTMVVGDSVDPATVTPCEANGAVRPVGEPRGAAAETPATGVHVLGDEQETVELSATDGQLRAQAGVSSSVGNPVDYRDPDDVIVPVGGFAGSLSAWRNTGSGAGGLGFDTTRLPLSSLATDDLAITLGDVDGPGILTTGDIRERIPATALSSAPGGNRMIGLVHGANTTTSPAIKLEWHFTKAGVYCVPLTFSATLSDGSSTSVSKTLTFAVGNTSAENEPDYVDLTTVTTCARGQHGEAAKDPSTGDGSQGGIGHDDIYVPNESLTDSGAVILNNGHVDIASRVNGNTLQTWVKDTTESNDARYHPLTGSSSLQSSDRSAANNGNGVVFQLLPESKTTVPNDPRFAFLGAAGSTVYQVQQTQVAGLLWPGWSTEEIPSADTQGGVTWTLDQVGGAAGAKAPGGFSIYQFEAAGNVNRQFDTAGGVSANVINKETHAHGTWSFTAEGTYCLSFTRSAILADGSNVKDDFVLAVAVGAVAVNKVDPGSCFSGTVPEGVAAGTVDTTPAVAPSTNVAASQCTAGATILSSGHIDFGSRVIDGKLESLVKDNTTESIIWREPSATVLWLRPEAKVTSPGGAFASFLGDAGTSVWQVPQTQQPGIIWLGWNTEEITPADASSAVSWSLDSVDGPGSVSVYELSSFGAPELILQSGGSYSIPLNVHAHGNWAFSAQGIYRLHFTQTVTLANGRPSSDSETLTIAVGDVDPLTAVAGGTSCNVVAPVAQAPAEAAAAAATAATTAQVADRGHRSGGGTAVVAGAIPSAVVSGWLILLLVVGGVLVLAAAAAGVALYYRHVKRVVSA